MNTSGAIVGELADITEYDAFGNQLDGNQSDPFGYCGEYYDAESNLIYLRNRYYDTTTGRFINEDPIKDGLNWYVYCGNNPLKYFDPSGLKPGDDHRDASDLYKVAEEITNIVANQIYWSISNDEMKKQRRIWANEARYGLKTYVKEEFKDEGLAMLIDEVIDDGTINGVEENSSLLCVVAYYMDEITSNHEKKRENLDVSYDTLKTVYDNAANKKAFFYIDGMGISSDVNDLITKYIGESPSIEPGGVYKKDGKTAKNAFEFPFDTDEINYAQ